MLRVFCSPEYSRHPRHWQLRSLQWVRLRPIRIC